MPDSGAPQTAKLPLPGPLVEGEIPVASLFSGAGGLDAGFAAAGFRTIFAADSMPAAVRSFNHNAGAEVAAIVDLLKLQSTTVVRAVSARAALVGARPRGLLGGPPCQGVSNGNNQAGPLDPRNRLFARYENIVLRLDQAHGLDFFVFENVPGLKLHRKNRPIYDKLVKRLGKIFDLHEAILDASMFGVPQTRQRLIIVGFNKKLKITGFAMPAGSADQKVTVRTAIGGLPEPLFFERGMDPRGKAVHANHWTMQPKSKKFTTAAPQSNDGRSFIRLEWDKQSRTVAYGHREIHVHPSGKRRISVYEALRLQGFPESFELLGNLSEQVTQVSNAVPPPVAQALAESIAKALAGARGGKR